MYKFIKLRHDIIKQCHGNYKEMKKFNYKLQIEIFRNSTQNILGVLRGSFQGFGCPKRHPDALLAKTMPGSSENPVGVLPFGDMLGCKLWETLGKIDKNKHNRKECETQIPQKSASCTGLYLLHAQKTCSIKHNSEHECEWKRIR